MATIRAIYISEGHDFKGRFGQGRLRHEARSVEAVECVAGQGLAGDRYFGYKEDFKGQITFLAEEAIRELEGRLERELPDWSLFRRNVVVSGVDLNGLVGKRFELGGVRFVGTEECRPCFWMDQAIAEGAYQAMEHLGGLRCRIQRSGTLSLGQAELKELSD